MRKKFISAFLFGALAIASTSTLVSCKDYDDDISAVNVAVESLKTELGTVKSNLETELNSVKSSFETQIASAKDALQKAIDAKADAETVKNLEDKVKGLETDLAAAESRLKAQIDAANDAIDALKSDVNSAKETLAALTGKLDDEVDARKALEKNLEIQQKALEDFQKKVSEDNKKLQDQIDELNDKIKNFATDGTVEELQKKVKELTEQLDGINGNIDAMTVLVERALSSIALVPSLYVDGIETIEFMSLAYTPVAPGTSGLTSAGGAQEIRIDNGLTEATYRLNPTTVQRDGIDEANIEFKAAKAETRAAAEILENSPVQFNGIKEFNNGLMTVYLKKSANFTGSLASDANGKIYIVSLKVPRNAAKYEAADIYSENSRLSEKTITPRIAVLPWESRNINDTYKAHYCDSTAIYGTRIDDSPSYVTKEIYYKDATNLLDFVTGCYGHSDLINKTDAHNQITKDELKKYGLTFRFAIAKHEYVKETDHNTNQQAFASVTPEGILTSKTPAGLTNNEAVVGKEPIIRIDLVDTVRNKLVDQRYMKVKWTLTEKPAVELDGLKSSEGVLPTCENVVKAEITWEEFVNEVYAKARLEGISQDKFETIYPAAMRKAFDATWKTNWNPTSDTSAPATGTLTTSLPVIEGTRNEHGDALIATWTLSPADIETVYCNSASDTKTFTSKVLFKSSMPSEYPDLWFNWTFTIKLPALPSINGYYEQYWLNNKVGQEHDVLAVQYNTKAYDALDNASNGLYGVKYCVFDNNLMNAFTYEMNGDQRQFIVKDVPKCGTWDLQFSYNQTQSGFKPDYTAPGTDAWKSKGQWTNTKHEVYDMFAGYKLMRSTTQALQLNWTDEPDDKHSSWCGNPAHKTCNVFADHNNPANQALLNPLGQNDVTGIDGTVTPERTHNKPINMTVWATLNNYNYIPVLNYKMYLVEPLRINAKESIGKFQDGVASGDVLNWKEAFTLTDFRGYLVANVADNTYSSEQKKYTMSLWKYYEVNEAEIDKANIRYTFARVNGGLKPNTALSYAQSLTSKEISDETNGNIVLSMTPSGDNLIFKNNGGSNIEENVKAYIPVTVKYGFGTLTAIVTVDIVPHGHK